MTLVGMYVIKDGCNCDVIAYIYIPVAALRRSCIFNSII